MFSSQKILEGTDSVLLMPCGHLEGQEERGQEMARGQWVGKVPEGVVKQGGP